MSATTSKKTATQPYAWIALGVVFIASVAAAINQMKVPPLMPILMDEFDLSIASSGLLMSVFAVTGLILSLPAGVIIQRLGLKTSGLLAVGTLAVGAFTGLLAPNYTTLLASRVLEGVGMGLIAVVAPAVIAAWFPAEQQGLPMGIWANWVPLGSLVMYLLAPSMTAALGWHSVWWLGALFALAALILYAAFIRMPQALAADGPAIPQPAASAVLANPGIWLLGAAFTTFSLGLGGHSTYYPTFLVEARGMSLAAASGMASLTTVTVLFAAPLAGILSDKIGSRRLVFSIPFVLVAILMIFPYIITGWLIPVWLVALGLLVGAIPTAIFAAVPELVAHPSQAGMGMAMIMLGQSAGMFASPLLFGGLVENYGWAIASFVMAPICLAGFLIATRIKVR